MTKDELEQMLREKCADYDYILAKNQDMVMD